MVITELQLSKPEANYRTQQIRSSLRRIERRDWWLWGYASLVMLSLTAAVVSLSFSVLTKPDEPFFQFHISQSVHGLVAVVLLFNIYTIYQEIRLKRLRRQLAEQMEVAAEHHRLAMLDPLTHLHNRRFAEERLTAEIARNDTATL